MNISKEFNKTKEPVTDIKIKWQRSISIYQTKGDLQVWCIPDMMNRNENISTDV